ncbi:MAG: BON domain-containing protein, partial [Verrucomicrobiaceae bacterium]
MKFGPVVWHPSCMEDRDPSMRDRFPSPPKIMKPEKTFHYRGPMTALAAAVLTSTMALATPEMQLESADEVAEFIRVDMQSDSHMKGTSVNVAVEDGIAILTGETLSLAQAERAAARSIASKGIRSVVNQITVRSSEDSDLAGKVKSTLKAQQIIGADDIKVSLSGSRVTLTGTVGVWDEKDLAREIVSEVPGIQAITNNLSVTDEGIRTDAQIEHQLQFIFQDDPLYNGLDLAVTVKDGTVSLSGEVGSQRELDRLIRRSYVTGIVDVNIMSLGVDGSLVMEGLDDKNPPAAESVDALKDALANMHPLSMGHDITQVVLNRLMAMISLHFFRYSCSESLSRPFLPLCFRFLCGHDFDSNIFSPHF